MLTKKRILALITIQHAPYGVHAILPQPCECIALLREPWTRMVSDYYHAGRNRGHSLYDRFQHGASLRDFVHYRAYEQGLTNPMVRFVSGLFAFPPFEPLPEDALEVAKRNIRDHFSVAGISEQFDESLRLMKRRYGWKNVLYRKRNVGRNRPPQVVVGADVKQEFMEANAWDYEL
jgi:hypothetical protein